MIKGSVTALGDGDGGEIGERTSSGSTVAFLTSGVEGRRPARPPEGTDGRRQVPPIVGGEGARISGGPCSGAAAPAGAGEGGALGSWTSTAAASDPNATRPPLTASQDRRDLETPSEPTLLSLGRRTPSHGADEALAADANRAAATEGEGAGPPACARADRPERAGRPNGTAAADGTGTSTADAAGAGRPDRPTDGARVDDVADARVSGAADDAGSARARASRARAATTGGTRPGRLAGPGSGQSAIAGSRQPDTAATGTTADMAVDLGGDGSAGRTAVPAAGKAEGPADGGGAAATTGGSGVPRENRADRAADARSGRDASGGPHEIPWVDDGTRRGWRDPLPQGPTWVGIGDVARGATTLDAPNRDHAEPGGAKDRPPAGAPSKTDESITSTSHPSTTPTDGGDVRKQVECTRTAITPTRSTTSSLGDDGVR